MADYTLKRLTLFAGHYGSGKTNLAVNFAIKVKQAGYKVKIADLDIVNPYFRTKDSAAVLTAAGIELISPAFANTNLDLPALPSEVYGVIGDRSCHAVLDIGGDDRGAYALGRWVPEIIEENDYEMVFVANFFRPLTKTAEEALEVMREIEAACGIGFTAIINNSNLGNDTRVEDIASTFSQADKLSALSGLPIIATAISSGVQGVLGSDNVFKINLQEKYFDIEI